MSCYYLFDYNCSSGCEGESHCGFGVRSSDDFSRAHCLFAYPFWINVCSIQILRPVFKLIIFLLLSYKSSLYILDTSHLSDI